MTDRINYTPEAQRQLNAIDEWITEKASRDVAQHFVSAILDCIDGIVVFPLAGRARADVRPGMRTTTFHSKRTLIDYEVDWASAELVASILGVFHARSGREAALPRRMTRPWRLTLDRMRGVSDRPAVRK